MYSPVLERWMRADPAGYVDGSNLYQLELGNPIGYTDPYGLESRSRATGGDFDSDPPGQDILLHWLGGSGSELDIDGNSTVGWRNYMQANKLLSAKTGNEVLLLARDMYDKPVGTQMALDKTVHAEIENGEGIMGYHYLHGSNGTVGDYHIGGTATVVAKCTVKLSLVCTWNDIIDPNPKYTTDKIKAGIARVVKPKDYTIRITWRENSAMFRDERTKQITAKGWPFELKEYEDGVLPGMDEKAKNEALDSMFQFAI